MTADRIARLAQGVLAGEATSIARAISTVESGVGSAAPLLAELYPHTGKARVLGLTGSPGSGKSSLVDRLVAALRRRGSRVGVIAVDPSSAFSGGAILGDRVRMQDHAQDDGVFIRSMATRGYLGGLCRAANDAVDILDAAGYDPIVIETVGVGQDEVEIVRVADVVNVVLVPGMGDDIQAIKAGILEIADLFVINKADRPGADRVQADLDYMLSLAPDDERPRPRILQTVAVRDEGIDELVEGIFLYLEENRGGRGARRRERAEARFLTILQEALLARARKEALPDLELARIVEEIADRKLDPYSAAQAVVSGSEAP